MVKNWRIKKTEYYDITTYVLEKQFLGFLFWYNPDNIDAYTTGVYNTLEEARESYVRKTSKNKITYIGLNDENI